MTSTESGDAAKGFLILGAGFGAGKTREYFVRRTEEYKSAVSAFEGAQQDYLAAQLRLDAYSQSISKKLKAVKDEYVTEYQTYLKTSEFEETRQASSYGKWYDGPKDFEEEYVEVRTKQLMLEADLKLQQLSAERDQALQSLNDHHDQLVRTTTRVGTAEADTDGVLYARRGGRIRTETNEVSETHAHDPKWFELKDKYDTADSAFRQRIDEVLKIENPTARAQALAEVESVRRESGVLPTDFDAVYPERSNYFDWETIDKAAGVAGFIPPWVWVVGGILATGFAIAATENRRA